VHSVLLALLIVCFSFIILFENWDLYTLLFVANPSFIVKLKYYNLSRGFHLLLICILIYLLLQLLMVILVARNVKTENDYYLAGGKLGYSFATLSIFATWFGVETCMGSSSVIYSGGLFSSRAEPFAYTLCLLLMSFLLATRLWKTRMTTLSDLFRERYQSKFVEKLSVCVIVPSSMIWAAAQIKAFGHIVSSVAPVSLEASITFAVAIVIAYAVFGGLIGDVITDVIQGIVLIIGLCLLFYFAIQYFFDHEISFYEIDPKRLNLIPDGESIWQRIDAWCVPIIGSLISQELIFRILASKTATVAKRSCQIAAGLYFLIGLLPVGLGILGPHILPSIQHPDNFLMEIATFLLPYPLLIVFTGALISAILSTVDSTLLSISAFTTHNLMGSFYFKRTKTQQLILAKLSVVIVGLVAYILALRDEGIYDLVIWASSLGTAGLAVVAIMALYTPKFGNGLAASLTLITGIVAVPIFEKVPAIEAPYLATVVLCFLVFFFASVSKRKVPST
jgi:SSS family solute:Na+ symporter